MKQTLILILSIITFSHCNQHYNLPSYLSPPYTWVKDVHVAFQTHLDLGFTNFASHVCEEYFDLYFSSAIDTAKTMKYFNISEEYVYTSQPWLLLEFLDGLARCTDEKRSPLRISLIEDAIINGYISWNANPFSMMNELCDPHIFEESLKLSKILDKRYNKTSKITALLGDVPGITRSTIPIFARQGIKALHIGANSACIPPAVPQAFRWKHNGDELFTMISDGYGGNITLKELNVALVLDVTSDNSMPQSIEGVIELLSLIKSQYPNANIHCGIIDDFVNAVMKDPGYAKLPIFNGEMGNTWLYGLGSDPWRVSHFREIRRTMMSMGDGKFGESPLMDTILRRLLKIPEHNWGLSTLYYLIGNDWSNEEFHYNYGNYARFINGWKEARSFLFTQPEMVPSDPINNRANKMLSTISQNLNELLPSKLNPIDYTHYDGNLIDKVFSTAYFDLSFNESGSLVYLKQKYPHVYIWANETHPIGSFVYQTYTNENFHIFNTQYNPQCLEYSTFICSDFGKQGMDSTYSIRKNWSPQLTDLYFNNFTDYMEFALFLKLDPTTSTIFGAPKSVEIQYRFYHSKPVIDVVFQWFDKVATRLPESMWLMFKPVVGDPKYWQMDVMGSLVSPYEVVNNGSKYLHSIWTGIYYNNSNAQLSIISKDSNLVAPGDIDHLLNFEGEKQPNVAEGMHFNLLNNLWGTAFNQWYDQDSKFRFSLYFGIYPSLDETKT